MYVSVLTLSKSAIYDWYFMLLIFHSHCGIANLNLLSFLYILSLRCVVIEDSIVGLKAAKGAGMRCSVRIKSVTLWECIVISHFCSFCCLWFCTFLKQVHYHVHGQYSHRRFLRVRKMNKWILWWKRCKRGWMMTLSRWNCTSQNLIVRCETRNSYKYSDRKGRE